jgi:DNA-binding MarR family transcriptional regulator
VNDIGQSGATLKKAPPSGSGSAGTLYLVHALTHASRTSLDEALRPLELSSLQYTVMSVLAKNDNLSSSRLSRRFYVTPQAMGEIILLLERKGLIERREDPANKKSLLLSLTRLGKSVCAEGDAHVRKLERKIFGDLSATETATLRSILMRAASVLRPDEHREQEAISPNLTPRRATRRLWPRGTAAAD